MKYLATAVLFIFLATPVWAADQAFQWDPNTTDHVTGYKIYCGTSSRAYSSSTDVGMGTVVGSSIQGTVNGIPQGVRMFCAATAYNEDDESDYSDEVSFKLSWGKPGKLINFKTVQ